MLLIVHFLAEVRTLDRLVALRSHLPVGDELVDHATQLQRHVCGRIGLEVIGLI